MLPKELEDLMAIEHHHLGNPPDGEHGQHHEQVQRMREEVERLRRIEEAARLAIAAVELEFGSLHDGDVWEPDGPAFDRAMLLLRDALESDRASDA